MIKITAGLGSADDYKSFREAGADEVFTGYIPQIWQLERGLVSPLNRREVWSCGAQIGYRNELERLKETGAQAAITLNSLSYRPEEYPVIAEVIEDALSAGFDSFIVADPALIVYLNNTGLINRIRLHVSGEFGEMNRFTRDELIRLGASRIILNRKVTVSEIKNLTVPGIEWEAFFMNEMCRYQGAFCDSLHCDEMPPICREACPGGGACETGGIDGCGLCALYKLNEAGVTHLKIVGRGAHTEDMLYSIRLARMAVNLLKDSKTDAEYRNRLLKSLPKGVCSGKCYYTE